MKIKDEYRRMLEEIKRQRKEQGLPARNEDIAEELGYNRSYFSTLLGQKGNVTPDHIKLLRLNFPTIGNAGLSEMNTAGSQNVFVGHEQRLLKIEATLEVYESVLAGMMSEKKSDFHKHVEELKSSIESAIKRKTATRYA